MGDDALTLVQMEKDTNGVGLFAADRIEYPADMRPGSVAWAQWAVEAIARSVAHGRFQGKKVIAAQPARDVFVDTIKMPELAEGELEDAIINRLMLEFKIDPEKALIRHVRNDGENVFVMASDRTKLCQHLAVYEKAQLKVKAMSVWPMAALGAYTNLWANHVGQGNPVMLLDIGRRSTRIVICDGANLYIAHASSVGVKDLRSDGMVDLLGSEMDMCRAKFQTTYKRPDVNRIIFVSGHSVDKKIYTAIAKQAQMPSQIGDCLDAVRTRRSGSVDPMKHAPHANWITAVGLSLSEIQSARTHRHSEQRQAS